MTKILISDKLSESGLSILRAQKNFTVVSEPELGKNKEQLLKTVADADALIVRSGTTVTAEVIAAAKNLKIIARAGIGVDNVDVEAASRRGIVVVNTPRGNVVTTAEHAISMMCSLTRAIPQATASIKAGKWEKSKFLGVELCGKTLGIVGCGNIGKIVADRAQGLRMKVVVFDPFLTDDMARELRVGKVSFDELLTQADYVTIHTPLNEKTKHLFDAKALGKMKSSAFLINCARGGLIDEVALAEALQTGKLAGAALDVFEKEPPAADNALLKSDRVICTPHLGAATEEAQENVAIDAAEQISAFFADGTVTFAVNAAALSKDARKQVSPALNLAEKMGSLLGQLSQESPTEVRVAAHGDLASLPIAPLTAAVLRGLLKPILSGDAFINEVNAPYLARERGIAVHESRVTDYSDYSGLIEVSLAFASGKKRVVAGALFGRAQPRIVRFDGVSPEAWPEGCLLIVENKDIPGVVGRLGTYLGTQGVNITRLQLGLDEARSVAVAFYNLGGDISEQVVDGVRHLDGILSATKVLL